MHLGFGYYNNREHKINYIPESKIDAIKQKLYLKINAIDH